VNIHKNPRVLVVEDDEPAAGVIQGVLENKLSAQAEIARSLREAREMLAASTFDAVTLAYLMPDGTGLELLVEITSKENHPPVIMVTGHGNEEVASCAVRDGASGYVVKNEELETRLAEAVRRSLESSAFQRVTEALHESEAFYHTLFDDSFDPLFIETIDGVIENANHAACKLLGYQPGELDGMRASDLLPPDIRNDFEDALSNLLAGETIEFENLHSDGSRIPVLVAVKEVITRRGPRFIVTVRDMSEVKRVKESLEHERSLTATAINTLHEIFILVDANGKYVLWNRKLNEVTGYTDDEIQTMMPADFHPPEDLLRVKAAIEGVLATGEDRRVETSIVTRDGRRIPFELSGALVRDENGEPSMVAGIGRDISERKRAEEALRNMVKETNERREEITALLESTRMVLERSEFEDTARDIFRLCKKLIGATAGYVAVFAESGDEVLVVDPEALRQDFASADFMPVSTIHGKDFSIGRAFIENSVATSALAEHLPESQLAIQNLLLAPLVVDGETVGLIGLVNKSGGFTHRDSLMASAFGEIASVALQNARNLRMLKDSEERFRSVARTANEAIICADSEIDITFWNPGAEAMFGYRPDEALGRPLTMILPERMREARIQSMMKATTDGTPSTGRTYEAVGLHKDGTEFFMELSRSTPWMIGEQVFFTAIIRDITERKMIEEALAASKDRFQHMFDNMGSCVAVYKAVDEGADFIIVDFNAAAERVEKVSREEIIGKPLTEVFPGVEDFGLLDVFRRVWKTSEAERSPVTRYEDERVSGWKDNYVYKLPTGEIVTIYDDITEQKQAEEALQASEQRLRLLFDTAPDVIYSINSDGELVELNMAFENLTGYSREEWMGKSFAPLVHPDDLELAIETFEQTKRGEHPQPYELRIRRNDGEYVTAEFISAPLMRGAEIAGEFGIARDVTARREAERALAESEELYKGLLATSPDAVVVTDLDFKVAMVSDRAVEQQRAGSAEDLIGLNTVDIIAPAERERALGNAMETLRSGTTYPQDFTFQRRDGTTFQGELMAALTRDADGNPKAFVATIRDVTERRRAEHELQVLNNELEGYAHAVSHDLKGPLSSIAAASATIQSLLKGEPNGEAMRGVIEMAAIIENSVRKSDRLIEDLLELAEAGQKPIDATGVDIGEVVQSILDERRAAIKDRRVKVKADHRLGTVVASPTHMYQLFSNLIDNCIKHNDAKKPAMSVEYIGADETGGHRYRVRDNGPGISPEEVERIFLPFFSGAEGESGIGLATVEKIVGVYGGTISVSSDEGACFEFVLYDAG
jgi:PAS domain S-box-containing protein